MVIPDSPSPAKPSSSTGDHLDRIRDGDRAGFEGLYLKLAPAIYAWACLRIHPSLRGRIDPEDVVQEVWWRAMDSFASFDPAKGSFRSWVFSVATHTLLNGFRHLRVRGEIAGDLRRKRLDALPPDLAAQATSISKLAARSESVQVLLTEVNKLPPEDRALFAHCALEGLSAVKAAALIGVSADAATKRWQRLRESLRQRMAASGVSDAD